VNTLILGGIAYVVNWLTRWIIWAVGWIAVGIGHLALLQANLPWVQNMRATTTWVAVTLLGVYTAYKAFHHYILWNEGTADPDGSVLFKSILRTIIYIGISGTLAIAVFNWGLALAATLTSTTMLAADQSFHGIIGNVVALPGSLVGLVLALVVGILAGVVMLVIVSFQVAIRAAELVVYVVAAPLVALGQMNADGGTWSAWWQNLVILSLSQAVQMLSFVGLVESTQVLTTPADTQWIQSLITNAPITAPVAMQADVVMTVVNTIFTVLLMIGWLVVALRGPHLLKQWAYHTGVGSSMMYVGTNLGKTYGGAGLKALASRVGIGIGG